MDRTVRYLRRKWCRPRRLTWFLRKVATFVAGESFGGQKPIASVAFPLLQARDRLLCLATGVALGRISRSSMSFYSVEIGVVKTSRWANWVCDVSCNWRVSRIFLQFTSCAIHFFVSHFSYPLCDLISLDWGDHRFVYADLRWSVPSYSLFPDVRSMDRSGGVRLHVGDRSGLLA